MPLRVPILNPNLDLPKAVNVLEESLPDYLKQAKVASKDDLAEIDGVTVTQVQQLISQARTDLLEQMQDMVAGVLGRSGYLFRQDEPVSTVVLQHDFDRDGPVSVTVYSLDYSFIWEFYEVHRLDRNRVQLTFDDPIAFNAIVL